MTNVIVFSQYGNRPDCNKMSCGDLDGDVYFVSWDIELISSIKKFHDAAPLQLSDEIQNGVKLKFDKFSDEN